ncbi:LytTR family DNA-binding domain-containing protein [Sediminicola luteus]|uniref:HTH LytTR-type domain-containing protein n=1 Tax=Sediminicola luteus TaxID=319238 RepID=A0A2A4GE44_9FLAO|nr:LytTR family DNA-binding domain-containing protein [Sediminicola luteus]PCE66681.1 hypothetical protein B7P33_05155 [Sediminicola luteus]
MITVLSKPYYGLDPLKSRLVFVGALLVLGTFLMVVLNPFNITEWLHIPKWIAVFKLSGLAIFSTMVVAVSQLIIRPLLNFSRFKIYHLIITIVLELLGISLILALIYGDLLEDFWSEYLNTAQYALTGTLLPYGMALLIAHFVGHKPKEVSGTGPTNLLLKIKDDKNRLQLSVQESNLLYLEATGNYVVVHYSDATLLRNKSIRITLKKMETQLADLELIRCHRSFIVHKPMIQSVKKEEGVYRVFVKNASSPIPVSRSFESSIKAFID